MFLELQLDDFRIFKQQSIKIGKTLTAIAGHNATGKSTILGILGNSSEIKVKDGTTITDKAFRTEFSELFRGSKTHDKLQGKIGKIIFAHPNQEKPLELHLRVTWQRWKPNSKSRNRFRIIPSWINPDTNTKTERKLPVPSFYLGLSRLYPIGENHQEIITEKKFKNKLSQTDWEWLIEKYKYILSIETDIDSVSNYEINNKRSGGINTTTYDYLSNSCGQDNLMQILYLLLSFKKLYENYKTNNIPWFGGLLLIDEIDATLHPAAQIRLMELLHQVCLEYSIQAVFTTHSLQMLEFIHKLQQKNSDINIEYLTTANNTLQIIHNPSYDAIENDMLISNFYLNNTNKKMVVYSEDAEARWMIEKLLKKYNDKFQLVDLKLGAESQMSLLYNDPDYFKNVLFILDGDKDFSDTKYKDLPQKYCNVLFLPGKKGPEALIYDYLISLSAEHEIISNNFDKGITIRYFKDNGPFTSKKYKSYKKDRDKYKQWFLQNYNILENINALDYWIKDYPQEATEFIDKFKYHYNIIASRTRLPKIK